jgi:serine/threonine protein kinase
MGTISPLDSEDGETDNRQDQGTIKPDQRVAASASWNWSEGTMCSKADPWTGVDVRHFFAAVAMGFGLARRARGQSSDGCGRVPRRATRDRLGFPADGQSKPVRWKWPQWVPKAQVSRERPLRYWLLVELVVTPEFRVASSCTMSEDRSKPPDPGRTDGDSSPKRRGGAEGMPTDVGQTGTGDRHRREQGSFSSLFAPGSHIGRYRLLAPLASGGMAQVWAAKPEGVGFGRTVALKLIRKEYAADEEYARMFVDEATVAASIHHPNVCEIHELGREEGVLFMAIEWVAGDSLAGILHREQGLEPIPERLAARIVADVCGGLHAAHEVLGSDGGLLGVVHRDVSPPNILLSLQGQVKVSDFGIAKAKYQLHSRTRTGEIKGKFAYIAPEQIGGRNIDRRADIFALGCVLYVATVGLRPFGSGPRAMSKILGGEYKRPGSLVDGYPAELEQVIARCLQKSPADRYPTADEMRTDLEQWLLTSASPVGTKDIAALVGQRLDVKKRRVVETLMRSDQFLPDAMVYQLVRGEVELTPTATSSVMFGPSSLTDLQIVDPLPRKPGAMFAQKPMVRFTALGRPLAPDTHNEPAEMDDGRTRVSEQSTCVEEDPTMSQGVAPSILPSSAPPQPSAIAAPTYRPPRLAPLHGVRPSPTGGIRPELWTIAGVLIAIVVGWASCQLLPP